MFIFPCWCFRTWPIPIDHSLSASRSINTPAWSLGGYKTSGSCQQWKPRKLSAICHKTLMQLRNLLARLVGPLEWQHWTPETTRGPSAAQHRVSYCFRLKYVQGHVGLVGHVGHGLSVWMRWLVPQLASSSVWKRSVLCDSEGQFEIVREWRRTVSESSEAPAYSWFKELQKVVAQHGSAKDSFNLLEQELIPGMINDFPYFPVFQGDWQLEDAIFMAEAWTSQHGGVGLRRCCCGQLAGAFGCRVANQTWWRSCLRNTRNSSENYNTWQESLPKMR